MEKDRIFVNTASRASGFEFDAEVARVFDDMLVRSVPFYLEQQFMIKELVKNFLPNGTNIYDLGYSTGTTLINLRREIDKEACFIGYDNSEPMIEKARARIEESGYKDIQIRYGDLNGGLPDLRLDNAGAVTMCWTLQFIRPLGRDKLIRTIYNNMVDEGVLIVTEKILTDSTHMNRFFINLYYDFKKRNGYSDEEIIRKREALENVLIPYRIKENLEMFRRSGFEIVETFFQWYNFAGFLCVKSPSQNAERRTGSASTLQAHGGQA